MRLINIRISNTRFETRDVQNRIKKVKSEEKSKSENDYLLLTHIRLDDSYKFSTF